MAEFSVRAPGGAGRLRQVAAWMRGERALPIPVIQLLHVLTVALCAPGVTDVIARVEARLLARRFFRWE